MIFVAQRLQKALAQRLEKKVALITGAGSGIGRQTALLFAKHGAKVMVTDISTEKALETTKMINELSIGYAQSFTLDVSNADQFEECVHETEKAFDYLNVVLNNAGIMHSKDDDALNTEDAIWDLTFNINCKGVFYGCKHSIPALLRIGGGSIINIASFVALRGSATAQIAYTSSKGAVLSMTRELAVIHAKQNIRFNCICPGPLKTELLMRFLDTEEKKQRRLVHIPMGRFGEAYEIANAALFLASDESSFMTGTEMIVDGGLCAAYVTPE